MCQSCSMCDNVDSVYTINFWFNVLFQSDFYNAGVCDPHHCGNTFCPGQNFKNCRVETSITPFAVSVHFGPPSIKRSPEENIGMCLRYTQLPCENWWQNNTDDEIVIVIWIVWLYCWDINIWIIIVWKNSCL